MSLLLLGVQDQSGPAWFRVQVRLLARALAGMVSVGWPWSVCPVHPTICAGLILASAAGGPSALSASRRLASCTQLRLLQVTERVSSRTR